MGRRDGKRVKNLDGMHSMMPFIMPKRCDADVYINTKLDVTELCDYINKLKKKEEYKNLTYFHAFTIAMGKMIYNRPLLNRFIINRKYYDRNEVKVAFVAKKQFTDHSEEVMTNITIDKKDNIFTVSDKIAAKVNGFRAEKKTNNTDDFIDKIGKLPKFIKWFLMRVLIFLDNHDLLPSSLTDNLIYYSSVLVSNLGSINCDSIYHHLVDFGTNEILITIGRIQDEAVVVDGKVEIRKMCDFGITLDERIADGFYFAKSLRLLEHVFNNPKYLEEDADTIYEINK